MLELIGLVVVLYIAYHLVVLTGMALIGCVGRMVGLIEDGYKNRKEFNEWYVNRPKYDWSELDR